MKELNCGIYCEDISQKIFLSEFLDIFQLTNELKFNFNENFSNRYQANNSTQVLRHYVNVSIAGFRDFSLDILFVGLDYDDRERIKFEKNYNGLLQKLPSQTINKTIVFFPVQAIEHWMLFIKYKLNNPKSTKNISSKIEKTTRIDAKKQIYKSFRPKKEISEKISSEIFSQMDITWLRSKSESFKFFASKFEDAIEMFVN